MLALVTNSMMKVAVYFSLVALAASFQFQKEWDSWKAQYGKRYDDDMEELSRHAIWESNKLYVEEHNANADKWGYTLDTNEYADMESEEFARLYHGGLQDNDKEIVVLNSAEDPSSIDWRDKGLVTPVENQGQLGSSGIFVTIDALEGQVIEKTGHLVPLSKQQLIDCCDNSSSYYACIEKTGGIDTAESYPYTGVKGPCHFNPSTVGAKLTGYFDIPTGKCEALRHAVATIGPIAAAIDASHRSFQLYRSGIYSSLDCSSTHLDHAVLVIGYSTAKGQESYWLCKNSWGTSWGMEGFFKIAMKKNMCGICTMGTYPTV